MFFNKSKVDEAKENGDINYMKLYDSLNDVDKTTFEQLYERFNQQRQKAVETINLQEPTELEGLYNPLNAFNTSRLAWSWNLLATEYFETLLREPPSKDLQKYITYLQKLSPSVLANILSQEMIHFVIKLHNKSNDHSYYVSHLALKLGRSIEDAFAKVIMSNYRAKDSKLLITNGYRQKYWLYTEYEKWTPFDVVNVGACMLSIALELFHVPTANRFDPSIKESKPAFWRTLKTEKLLTIGIIKINSAVFQLISRNDEEATTETPSSLPLLVKPKPWTAVDKGGYLYGSQYTLLNTEQQANEQEAYVKYAIENHKMDNFLDSLDDLSSCAWGVNKRMLKVIDEIWSLEEPYLDIPGKVHEEVLKTPVGKLTYYEKRSLREKQMKIANKRCERNNFANALAAARMFAKHGDKFYYSYHIDFRGRVYPRTSSMFTHLGQDSIRSLLQFWYSKPLGKDGLRWLKIHLANMYGVDKISNDDRETFVNNSIDHIIDSAENPLTGGRWWADADNPFQSLAVCMEINDAIKMHNPENYLSRIAINQDGSCNGLQHYAALGGDRSGAAQVNMVAHTNKPSDVYSKVSSIVCEKIDRDAANGKEIAQQLQGNITRKLVKQPVMTSVYGVTKYGMVRQIDEKLIDMKQLNQSKRSLYSPYIAQLILEAIGELFSGANMIKQWLYDCTLRICESAKGDVYQNRRMTNQEFMNKYLTGIIWTTPLGLPVVQPYRNSQKMLVRTGLQSIALYNPFAYWFVDKSRQLQGIAPNYIHSLDSTHMLLTATECVKNGLCFAAVHDSFWTHASTVSQMNLHLRQQFIALHKQDLIERLRNEFLSRYDGYMQLVHVPPSFKSYNEILKLRSNYNGKEADELKHELKLELDKWRSNKTILTPSSILQKNNELGNYYRVGGQGGHFSLDKTAAAKSSVRVFVPLQIPHVPFKGDYDVLEVLNAEYFFS